MKILILIKKSLSLLLIFTFLLLGQKVDAKIKDLDFKGKVIDTKSKNPIPYVNISIEHHSFGTITNVEGDFSFNIPEKYQYEKIIFSCIGYESKILTTEDCPKSLLIEMTPVVLMLPEISIKPIDPVGILRESIKRISENYSQIPVCLNAFYREMIKVDSTFVKYTDAACKIYYCGYNNSYNRKIASDKYFNTDINEILPFPEVKNNIPHQNDQVEILETRKSNNHEIIDEQWKFIEILRKFEIGGGPLHITGADMVKLNNNLLDSTTWQYYRFQFSGITEYENNKVYKISFTPQKTNKIALYTGYIYISEEDYSIVQFEYLIDKKCTKFIKDYNTESIMEFVSHKAKKETNLQTVKRITKQIGQTINVKYTYYNNLWYINHILVENTYENSGDLFDNIKYNTYLELFVNDVENDVKPLDPDSTFHTCYNNFLYQHGSIYNPKFWEKYNTPVPSGLFKKAMSDIEKEKNLDQQFQENSNK